MSKRNVAFIKPEEPSFIKKLKQEIGYREGPTVDTKREKLPELSDDNEEKLDEQPVIVTLNPGDLTAEEFDKQKKKFELEEQAKPADLSQKIIFRPSKKNSKANDSHDSSKSNTQVEKRIEKKSSERVNQPTNKLLSFDIEEDES